MKILYGILKRIVVGFAILVVTTLLIEGSSYLMLSTGMVSAGWRQQLIVDRFPAQLRLDQKILESVLLPTKQKGFSDLLRGRFDFDPVMGYRRLSSLRWYTRNKESTAFAKNMADSWWELFAREARGKFLVLSLGGSTTAHNAAGNWPRHIPAIYWKGAKNPDVIVLNAGHDGFTAMQEQLYASYWILPRLEKLSLTPSVVLTLDGVNDISFAAEGYRVWKQNQQANWYSHYSAYHQHLDRLYGRINSPAFAVRNLIGAFLSSPTGQATLAFFSHYLPTTLSLTALGGGRPEFGKGLAVIRSGVSLVFAYKNHNVFQIRGLYTAIPFSTGAVSLLSDGLSARGAKVAQSLSNVLDLIDRFREAENTATQTARKTLKQLREGKDLRDFSLAREVPLPAGVIRTMADAFKDKLVTLQSGFHGRAIPVISFLQPIAHRNYYGALKQGWMKEIPSFDYIMALWAISGTTYGGFYKFDGGSLYREAEIRYQQLAASFPEQFVNISRLFVNDAEGVRKNSYVEDNVHYTTIASVRIAMAIVNSCISAKACPEIADGGLRETALESEALARNFAEKPSIKFSIRPKVRSVKDGRAGGEAFGRQYAFDGNSETFWESTIGFPLVAEVELDRARIIGKYAFYVGKYGNDSTARMPASWTLQGSNDGVTWREVDSKAGISEYEEGKNYAFKISSPGRFSRYRFKFTKGVDPKLFRISEIIFYGQ